MFETLAEATKALERLLDPPRLQIVVDALVPSVVFKPIPGGRIVLGGTRLGGTPDLPAGMEWPRPPMPDNPEEIAGRGSDEAVGEMRAHLALGLPYAFIAQVDLKEASALGPVTSALPPDGRLLFYYDISIGPWETGTRPTKVVWDQSPREALVSAKMPEDLAAADRKFQEELDAIRAQYGGTKSHETQGSNYAAPARSMILSPALRLPERLSIDFPQALETDDDDFEAAYDEVLEESIADIPAGMSSRQQLLGSPMPEQDDPRYQAVVATTFGRQFLSSEEWDANRAKIDAEARDWTLLLQLDLADWMQQDYVEGTVYFLIRKSDLKHRHFDKVVAVYQQT